MDWLNYHHLLYFWTVAKEGSVSRACQKLSLAQPTISGQIRALERALGEKLFAKQGRHLVLTEIGQVVFRYAQEIFTLGQDLVNTLKGQHPGRPVKFVVGIADVVPKLIAYRLLKAAIELPNPVQIICWEGKLDRLLAELAVHGLDLVLADTPVPPTIRVQAFNHLLGESGVSLFAEPKLARAHGRGFPQLLDGAPFLLPTSNATLRQALDDWFAARKLHPSIIGEFEDSATMKAFGQAGIGIFPGPTAVEKEIIRQYRVHVVGRIPAIRHRFYAITVERRLKHPAVLAISESARSRVLTQRSS